VGVAGIGGLSDGGATGNDVVLYNFVEKTGGLVILLQ